MPLPSGTRLGPYEIDTPLGAGGMGEVYRARDTRLERTVAIKVLPPHLSSDPARKQRFEREAKTISSLNHPHICVLHDIGHDEGIDYLVMECVEGETLAKRLEKGPLSVEQVLKLGAQVADALHKAHRKGIVHRDLKPGNIMLTASGAKLLDFGLAKPVKPLGGPGALTATKPEPPATETGAVVGTYQYMSPEQIEGKELDGRSDIFSLGAVLYEMVTGKRAFGGKSQISVMSAILEKEPEPVSAVQPLTPPTLERVVRQCLAKDPDERIQTAHDLRLQLEWIRGAGSQAGTEAPDARRRVARERWAWTLASVALLAAIVVGVAYWRAPRQLEVRAVRAVVPPPEKATFLFLGLNGSAALSPDGRMLAFVARKEQTPQIWVRALDSYNARPLPGTENGTQVFWSPDSRNLGFFVGGMSFGTLKRVPIAGGPPLTLCNVESSPRGGSWNSQDVIIYGSWPGVIYRVPASGGKPEKVTKFNSARNDTTHRWPHFLPDGNHFVYMASPFGSFSPDNVFYLGSLDGKTNRVLFQGSSNIAYASGYLLYVVDKALMARPFDPAKLDSTGDAMAIAEGLQFDTLFSESVFSVSNNGLLIYQTGNASSARNLVLFDVNGRQVASVGEPGPYFNHRFSPNGKRLAYHLIDPQSGKADIWLQERATGSRIRLTVDPVRAMNPVWSRDSTQIAYTSIRSGKQVVYIKSANGMAAEQKIWEPPLGVIPNDWTPDSKGLILQERFPTTGNSRLILIRLDGKAEPTPLIDAQNANLTAAQLSPNGRWLAYQSDELGKEEIYVSPFPRPEGRLQISVAGGVQPRWRRDSNQLFYLAPDGKMMAAALKETQGLLQALWLQPLFQTGEIPGTNDSYDVAPDGKAFLLDLVATEETAAPLSLVENWAAELKK